MKHSIDFFTIEECPNNVFLANVDSNILYGELDEVLSRFKTIKDFVTQTCPSILDVKFTISADSYDVYVDAQLTHKVDESTQ